MAQRQKISLHGRIPCLAEGFRHSFYQSGPAPITAKLLPGNLHINLDLTRILCYTVGGLHEFKIERGGIKNWQWWQEAMFSDDISSAVELQLIHMCPMILPKQRETLVRKIAELSKSTSLENDFFMKNIAHESYRDILENEKFCAYMSDCTRAVNLEMLPEIDEYSIRVIRNEITDRVDLVLHIAKFNLELVMATQVDNADILVSEGAEDVLANKLRRKGLKPPLIDGFIKLLELNNIPDISVAVSCGHIGLPQIWELRQKIVARQFRRWLREANPTDSRDIERAYVQALKASPASISLPIKVLRFAVTNIVGALDPIAGFVAGGVDNFFFDKFVSGFSPRLFLDQVSKLPNANR